MGPNNFTQGHLMKTKWSPDSAKRDIFGVILGVFWPIQAAFVANVRTPS